jgi:hypothetical protein
MSLIKLNFFSFFIKNIFWRKYLYISLGHDYKVLEYKNTLYTQSFNSLHQSMSTRLLMFKLNPIFINYTFISNIKVVYFYINYLNVYLLNWLRSTSNKSFSFGFRYMQGFIFLLFIDACLTDDEPLWEPIEWSLVQTWILFIFLFAWVAENLIVSRYGSYTGRDKRVWMAWYKTFWLIEGFYIVNYGAAIVFVIVPFYYEINYNLSFVFSWWHWYSRVFFF